MQPSAPNSQLVLPPLCSEAGEGIRRAPRSEGPPGLIVPFLEPDLLSSRLWQRDRRAHPSAPVPVSFRGVSPRQSRVRRSRTAAKPSSLSMTDARPSGPPPLPWRGLAPTVVLFDAWGSAKPVPFGREPPARFGPLSGSPLTAWARPTRAPIFTRGSCVRSRPSSVRSPPPSLTPAGGRDNASPVPFDGGVSKPVRWLFLPHCHDVDHPVWFDGS